jgi:hypothetical protein
MAEEVRAPSGAAVTSAPLPCPPSGASTGLGGATGPAPEAAAHFERVPQRRRLRETAPMTPS